MIPALLRRPLVRDIGLVVAAKIILIILASVYLFPADARPAMNAEIVAQKLFGYDAEAGK